MVVFVLNNLIITDITEILDAANNKVSKDVFVKEGVEA